MNHWSLRTSLPGWKPLLLPWEKAILHQIGRRIQTCPPGRKKRPRIHLPLARRISHPWSPRRPCRSDPGRRKDTGQKSHHHTQLASGCTSISFCGTAGGREGVYWGSEWRGETVTSFKKFDRVKMPHIIMHMWHFSVNIILKIKRLSINQIYRKPLKHCG